VGLGHTTPQEDAYANTPEVLTGPEEGGGVVVPVSCRVAPSAVLRRVRGAAAQSQLEGKKGFRIAQI
jgi:hypothetical protein